MPKHKNDRAYLWDMLESSQRIFTILQDKSFHQFIDDYVLRLAVERLLEIIGEAANQISLEQKNNHSEIPWKEIIGQRHIIVHDYDDIKYERIWNTCKTDIPKLIEQLKKLL